MSGPVTRLAVLGHPVAHSRSPAMQNAALSALGLDGWAYEAIDVKPDRFEDLVRTLPGRGFAGVNVTVPHKEAALVTADEASGAARAIGAANTLVFEGGRIRADNTDAPGLIDALTAGPEDGARERALAGRPALVLGAGGAGRAVTWALKEAGMDVTLWNRTRSRAEALAAKFGVGLPPPGDRLDAARFDVIVNASAAGLGGTDALAGLPLSADGFRPGQTVVDMVYGESPGTLIAHAERGGARTIDGLEILVRQGARSLEIWTGLKPDLETMRKAARA